MAAAGDRPDYRLAVPGKTAGGASPYCVPAREDLWTIEGVPLVCEDPWRASLDCRGGALAPRGWDGRLHRERH